MLENKAISANLAWALVILGGIVECFWVSGLKYADSFALYMLTGLGIGVSFCCAILAMKRLEVSVCYAVFVGIGTAGVVVAEMLFFNEAFSLLKIALIALLLIGVIGLKCLCKVGDDEFVEEVSKDFGLDELEQNLASFEADSNLKEQESLKEQNLKNNDLKSSEKSFIKKQK